MPNRAILPCFFNFYADAEDKYTFRVKTSARINKFHLLMGGGGMAILAAELGRVASIIGRKGFY